MSQIRNYRQHTDLILRRKINGPGKLFYVHRPFVVSFTLDGKARRLEVPEDFDTDLASIPKIVPKWIASKIGPHIEGAVVHDFAYRVHLVWLPKSASDDLFLHIMENDGTNWALRHAMYQSVNLFGGPSWDANG